MKPLHKPKIIVTVKDQKHKQEYVAGLEEYAEILVVDSCAGLAAMALDNRCDGILIDLRLSIKATNIEKMKFSRLCNILPCGKLNYDSASGSVNLLMMDESYGAAETLKDFAAICAAAESHHIAVNVGAPLHLNAFFSPSADFVQSKRSFTTTVSSGGCFLSTFDDTCRVGDVVWIDFVGLSDRTPIKGRVTARQEWGVMHAAPGIAVSFESILEGQIEEINNLCKSAESRFHLINQ